MNKVIVMLSIILFILVACDNNDTGLEGKEVGISTLDPAVSEDQKENGTIKFSSGYQSYRKEAIMIGAPTEWLL